MLRSSLFIASICISALCLVNSCSVKKSNKSSSTMTHEIKPAGVPSPPAIVYKTKGDYSRQVPVILSADKKMVVSFPAQSDLRINGKFTYPDVLEHGYLLDNRGINQNTAFLKFTYEDYYNMDNIPTAERLLNYILDDDPFIEMYDFGRRGQFENAVEEINQIIISGKIPEKKSLLDK